MQSDWVEDHVCNAYAQALCDEAGKIWVCYYGHSFFSMQLTIEGVQSLKFECFGFAVCRGRCY